jgi:mitogen-activated protein kinase 15
MRMCAHTQALFPGTSTINQIERIMNTVSTPTKADVDAIRSRYAGSVLQKMAQRPLRPIDVLVQAPPAHSMDLIQK